MAKSMRALRFDNDLYEQVRKAAGDRGITSFFEQAAREKLERDAKTVLPRPVRPARPKATVEPRFKK